MPTVISCYHVPLCVNASRPITASHVGPAEKQESQILTQSFTELAQSRTE